MDTPANHERNSIVPPAPDSGLYAAGAKDPETWGQWLASNALVLFFVAAGIGFIIWKQLDLLDLAKVAIGLGLVIFIHELGHFVAAKWCDVHVETFSIGFGKPLPGCYFKYGETTYKIGWIPLGGYVKMVGEGDNADSEEAEEDPRSFKNKPAGQRMIIISAGVCMNILLACICFVVAYMHGVEETPAIFGSVTAGSPAYREGLHSGAILEEIEGLKKPVFDDIRPEVTSTSKGETVQLIYKDSPDGPDKVAVIEPSKGPGEKFPTIGVGPVQQLTLISSKQRDFKPYRAGSPASRAEPPFLPGDKIIACSSDPSDYRVVTPLPVDKRQEARGKLDYFEFRRREMAMAGKKMIIRVERAGGPVDITVDPAFHAVNGMRMEMGRVAARRKDSPAAKAKVVDPAGEDDGILANKSEDELTGDKIIQVEVTEGKNGHKIRWDPSVDEEKSVEGVTLKPLDPLRLPFELRQWADKKPDSLKVRITVLRPTGRKEEKNESKRVALEMTWDPSAEDYYEMPGAGPMSIPCLGFAYYVNASVESVLPGSPAAEAGIQKGDLIKELRWKLKDAEGKVVDGKWQNVKLNHWAVVFANLQDSELKEFDVKVERSGHNGQIETTLKAEKDESWPRVDRGLEFKYDSRIHKADNLVDALGLGLHRTVRLARVIYQNLYAMVFGRISLDTMSGPLTIANVSYRIAGEDIWQFILFIGMINVNLAVINFLPIPILDGGHMVFLIYEKIRGKPAPEAVLAAAMYTGLALILSLMCFVLYLDVTRLF